MEKVRWGVLSTANIGLEKVLPGMQKGRYCEITAIASRRLEAAQEAATRLGLGKAYGAYGELLADPEIDAVYIPLPNDLHVPWAIKALEAGKHVLCEKPIALNAAQAEELAAAGRRHPRLKLMEAFMFRHHPQWQQARRIVRDGGVGELRAIQSFFSYYLDDAGNIRNQAEKGGGGLMDIGCYNVSLSRFIFGEEPERVRAAIEYDPRFHTDRLASCLLEFARGTSTFTCATQLVPYQRVNIFGTTGRLEIEIPFNAPPDQPCRLWHQRGETVEEIVVDACDQYTIQGDLFARAVLDDTPVPTPIDDAVANMRVIDALARSGHSHAWEPTA